MVTTHYNYLSVRLLLTTTHEDTTFLILFPLCLFDPVGLGIMGDGMARNLIKGGRDVVVWNRTGGKAVDFSRETGCQTAGTPREVRARTYVCISIVSSPYKNKKIISNSSTSPGVPEKKRK